MPAEKVSEKPNSPNPSSRITDSIWFWLAVYCGFGSAMLAAFGYLPLLMSNKNTNPSVVKKDSQVEQAILDSTSEQMTRDDRSNLAARILSPSLFAVALFSIGMLLRGNKEKTDPERE